MLLHHAVTFTQQCCHCWLQESSAQSIKQSRWLALFVSDFKFGWRETQTPNSYTEDLIYFRCMKALHLKFMLFRLFVVFLWMELSREFTEPRCIWFTVLLHCLFFYCPLSVILQDTTKNKMQLNKRGFLQYPGSRMSHAIFKNKWSFFNVSDCVLAIVNTSSFSTGLVLTKDRRGLFTISPAPLCSSMDSWASQEMRPWLWRESNHNFNCRHAQFKGCSQNNNTKVYIRTVEFTKKALKA